MQYRFDLIALLVIATVGCSPQPGGNDSGDAGGSAVDAVAQPDSALDVVPDAPIADAGPGSLTASIGPIHLLASEEKTMCVVLRLTNPTPRFVRRVSAHLGEASHHLIVYRSTETTERTTPFVCQGFSGIRDPMHIDTPLLIAQQRDAALELPTNTGVLFAANQMVMLEFHVVNIASAPADVRGDVTLETIAQDPSVVPADVMFWGNLGIHLPPHTTGTVDFFNRPWAGVNVFALTSHTHARGVLSTIHVATATTPDAGSADAAAPEPDIHDARELHRSTNWSDPPLTTFSPALHLADGEGFHLVCNYNNTTGRTIEFGQSVDDEMCFMWAYYYPAPLGTQVCESNIPDAPPGTYCIPSM